MSQHTTDVTKQHRRYMSLTTNQTVISIKALKAGQLLSWFGISYSCNSRVLMELAFCFNCMVAMEMAV